MCALLLNEGAGSPKDLALAGSKVTSGAWTIGPYMSGVSTASVGIVVSRDLGSTLPGITFYALTYSSWATGATLFLLDGRAGTGAYLINDGTAGTGKIYYGGTSAVVSTPPANGAAMSFCLTDNGTNSIGYVNGVQSGSGGSVSRSFGSGLRIGSRYSDTSPWRQPIFQTMVYNRALSPSEAAWLTLEPLSFLRPLHRRAYGFKSSGTAPSFKAYWAYRRQRTIGTGVI